MYDPMQCTVRTWLMLRGGDMTLYIATISVLSDDFQRMGTSYNNGSMDLVMMGALAGFLTKSKLSRWPTSQAKFATLHQYKKPFSLTDMFSFVPIGPHFLWLASMFPLTLECQLWLLLPCPPSYLSVIYAWQGWGYLASHLSPSPLYQCWAHV